MSRGLFRKILPFSLFKFLTEFGFACGFFSANSLLITRVGSSSLFSAYLGGSLLSLGASALFSLVVDRFPRKVVFFLLFTILGMLLVLFWALIRLDPQWSSLYFFTRILSYAVFVLTGLEFSILISLFFGHSESKQVFSFLVALSIIGEMSGGLFIHFTSSLFHTENFILVWGGILILSPFLLVFTKFPSPQTPGMRTSVVWGALLSPGEDKRSRSFFSSRLTLLLFVFWIAYSYFCYGTDYVFNTFAQNQIKGEDALTSFFGSVDALSCLVVLFYHLFVGPRLIRHFGIRYSLVLISSLYLLPWLLFLSFPSLLTVALSQGIIYFFLDHLSVSRMSTVLTLFPEKVRGRIQVFTEGFGRPLGTVLLFLVAWIGSFRFDAAQMTWILLGSALIFLAYPLFFRKPYFQHLLNGLHSKDQKLVENAVQALGEKGYSKAVDPLLTLLITEPSHTLKSAVIHSLGQIQTPESLNALSQMIETDEEAEGTQRSLIEAIGHSSQKESLEMLWDIVLKPRRLSSKIRKRALDLYLHHRKEKALPFLLSLLESKESSSQILSLEGLSDLEHDHFPPLAQSLLNSSNPRLRASAARALYFSAEQAQESKKKSLMVLETLLNSDAMEEKKAAIRAIGHLQLKEYLPTLVKMVGSSPSDKLLQLEILSALAQMQDPSFADPMLRLLLDADTSLGLSAADSWADLPPKAQKMMLQKFLKLREAQKRRILSRLQESDPELAHTVQAALT